MTPEQIFTALAEHEGLPRDAMVAAGQSREEMIPLFLDLIHRLQRADIATVADDDLAAFLFIYFLLGEWGDARAYRPFTALLRHDPEFLEHLLGQAITEGTARVIAGVFDGDMVPIIEVILDPGADPFIRGQMFDALALIANRHRQSAPEVRAFMAGFFDSEVEKPEELWDSWVFAVAELGLAELEPLVMQVYEQGWITPELSTPEDFRKALEDASKTGSSTWFHQSGKTGPIVSAIDELSGWHCFSNKATKAGGRGLGWDAGLSDLWSDTFERDEPKVGRNDPCSCGSGKKFKKCCLQ